MVLLVAFMWWTAEQERLDLHTAGGTLMLALLLFRVIWGVVGGSTARFASFVRGPRAVLDYLQGRTAEPIGHNPLGALSVVAMLAILWGQVALGLFASDDDGLESGPLAHLVSLETSEVLSEWHEDGFDLLLMMIALHLGAVLFYALFRRKNLLAAMLVGSGRVPQGAAPMRPAATWRFWASAAASALVAAAVGGFL